MIYKILNRVKNIIDPKHNFKRISFSQCGEDVIIQNLLGKGEIYYIDVGAHHPFYLSNTALFYEKGSEGINIEPDPELINQFRKHRKRDVNLNIGVSKERGNLNFYQFNVKTLNTFDEIEAKEYQKLGFKLKQNLVLKVETLNNIIKDQKIEKIDLLSIDVEGFDFEILCSIDFKIIRPCVICIETVKFVKSDYIERDDRISEYLLKKEYMVYAETPVNTIYVSKEYWLKRQSKLFK